VKGWGGRQRGPRLIVIVNWRDSAHPEAGGAELYCEQVARRLAAEGKEVVFLTAHASGRRKERRDGYTVIRRGGRFTVYPWALLWLLVHRRQVVGVIDSQNGIPFFSPLAVPRRTPVVLLLHHIHQQQFSLYFRPPLAAVGRWLERTGSRWVYGRRAVAAVSVSTRWAARRELMLRGPIHVIPCGLNMPATLPMVERSMSPRIACVGRLVPHKRLDLLIEAMPEVLKRVPDVELHLVGEGPERARLHDLVTARGLVNRVQLHGWLDAHARDELLASAWLTVNPSMGEGWGLSVLEANAQGVPAVAFHVPGLRDSVRDGETGWLVKEESDLAHAVEDALRTLDDVATAREWAQRTRAWAARFTWDGTARMMAELLAAERDRLERRDPERRQSSDLITRVEIPLRTSKLSWTRAFRRTDVWSIDSGKLIVLLKSSDEESAARALRRAGVTELMLRDPSLRVSVARPSEILAPGSGTPACLAARPGGMAGRRAGHAS